MKLLIIVTPNFNINATVNLIDPFRVSNYLDGTKHFDWNIFSIEGGQCVASNGMVLDTLPLSDIDADADTMIFISSSWTPEKYYSKTLRTQLIEWSQLGCTICAIDTGAFILANAGLLNGRKATVHYEHIDAMKELYPDVITTEDLFVIDDNRITCCGGSATTDLSLQIIHSVYGSSLANHVARYIFHDNIRAADAQQNPTAENGNLSTVPAAVRQAIKVMELHLEEPISIQAVSEQVSISKRQLHRLFIDHLNKTPTLYYRDIRLDRARGLVTQTDLPLTEVAIAAGFVNQSHFSRVYRERFGLNPKRDRSEGRIAFEFRAWPMHRLKPSSAKKRRDSKLS